jgi:hypothetical protein
MSTGISVFWTSNRQNPKHHTQHRRLTYGRYHAARHMAEPTRFLSTGQLGAHACFARGNRHWGTLLRARDIGPDCTRRSLDVCAGTAGPIITALVCSPYPGGCDCSFDCLHGHLGPRRPDGVTAEPARRRFAELSGDVARKDPASSRRGYWHQHARTRFRSVAGPWQRTRQTEEWRPAPPHLSQPGFFT